MRRAVGKFETTFWMCYKMGLYIGLMMLFIGILGIRIPGLTQLSRTYGVTVTAFLLVGGLFLIIYGKCDIGRRKSKPIIHSLLLAVVCTDAFTYIQVRIMQTDTGMISGFTFLDLDLIVLVLTTQMLLIIIMVYFGNYIFFCVHKPEKCMVITGDLNNLNKIYRLFRSYQRQYSIETVVNYRYLDMHEMVKNAETIFLFDVPMEERAYIMRMCYKYKKSVYFNPDVEDIMELHAEKYMLEDVCVFNKQNKALTMEQRIAKRLMDITGALIIGICSSPFWGVAAIAIKLNDGGPIMFKQERVTINGSMFKIYKFRTMRINNEVKIADENDDRITKVGKWLRKFRIDELPQMINVLKGDMSLVGPRPEIPILTNSYMKEIPEFEYRLRMKAGVTGYAQIAGKYNTVPKDKLILDMMYIEQFSIWKDIQLIFQTAIVLLKSDSTEGTKKIRKLDVKDFALVGFENE